MFKAQKQAKFKLPMKCDKQLLTYVLTLRFGTSDNPDPSKPLLNYQSIATLIRKPVSTVIELVKAGLHASRFGFN